MSDDDSRGSGDVARRCLNCEAPLSGLFCASCGQRDSRPNPTFREFADEWFTEVLHWDGKLPATLKALMLKPGQLTQDFLAGKRVRYLSPFRVYLIVSFVYFLAGPVIERLTGYSEKSVAQLQITGDSADAADFRLLTDSVAFVNDPEVQDNAVIRVIGAGKAFTLVNHQMMFKDIVAEAIPRAMFILLPFFALLTWITWRPTGLMYPAHLAFAFHVHSAYFAAMLVPKLIDPLSAILPSALATAVLGLQVLVQLGLLVYCTWYVVAASRRALGGTTKEIAVRTTVVGLIYAPVALVVVLGATVLAINAL